MNNQSTEMHGESLSITEQRKKELKFLCKTPWAKEKLEALYLNIPQ